MGNFGAQEYYGIVSGPLIEDRLAARLVGLSRERDGAVDGDNGSDDTETTDDRNVSLALNWRIADNWEANVRWNDRKSDRVIGQSVLVDQGPAGQRGMIDSDTYAYGIRPVLPGTPGALAFSHPATGATVYGADIRPGIDTAATHRPNSFFGVTGQSLDSDVDDLDGFVATNDGNNERFVHNALLADLTWDIGPTTSAKYIGGWMDFDYTYDIDNDWTNGTVSEYRRTVLEAVETHSHELQLLWQLGDQLQMTSGLYYFNSDRLQNYAFKDLASQGRYTDAVNYGGMAAFVAGLGSLGGNGSYTDTEYKSDFFVLEDDNPAFPAPLFPDTNGEDAFIVRNLKGSSLKGIPEWKFTTWTSYDWRFDAGMLTAGATWSYTGEYYSSGIERRLNEVPSRDRVDLHLTWRDYRDRWNVRAFVDNVLDDVNTRGIGTGTAASDWQRTATTLYPRFYGLDVTYRMGAG